MTFIGLSNTSSGAKCKAEDSNYFLYIYIIVHDPKNASIFSLTLVDFYQIKTDTTPGNF